MGPTVPEFEAMLAARVELESIEHVDSGARFGAVGMPLWTALVVGIIWSGIAPQLGQVSLATILLIATITIVQVTSFRLLSRYFRRDPDPLGRVAFWSRIYGYASVRGPLTWMASLWMLWEPGNVANNLFIFALAFGTPLMMITVHASHLRSFTIGNLALFLSTAAMLLSHSSSLNLVLLLLLAVWMVTIHKSGIFVNRHIVNGLRLRFENEAMAVALEAARDAAIRERQAAEDANNAKSSFLANMSHDLRTPLNAIMGFSDLIRQRVRGPIAPAAYGEYIDDIHDAGAHLLALINDILDLAKVEAGKYEFEPVKIDLEAIAEDALKLVEPQSLKAGVSLSCEIETACRLLADERALKQMLVNLLSNAIKFSNRGGAVNLYCRIAGNGSLLIGVRDEGAGMTGPEIARALEPFGQAGRKETVEGNGTGLGLPIVKKLVEAHGGQLRIVSEPGVGTAVELEFPRESVVDGQEAPSRSAG